MESTVVFPLFPHVISLVLVIKMLTSEPLLVFIIKRLLTCHISTHLREPNAAIISEFDSLLERVMKVAHSNTSYFTFTFVSAPTCLPSVAY